jgi:hypothetical protein
MISKGTTHNDGARLADYMTASKEGERAELWELRGFEATNIKDAFRDVQIMAGATKAEQPFFHVQVRNREGETLTREQFGHVADRIERMLGLTGQPRAITFHTYEHNGDEHMHVAWSRIDQDTLTARPLPFFKDRLKKISRELELHFGLEPVTSHREGHIKFALTRAEHEQARRLGLDVHEVRNNIRDLWDRSDSGRSFQAALEHEGFILAKGERRDFVVIDQAGGMHPLGKRMLDVTASKIRDRLSDISRDELPSVEMARALMPEPIEERTPQQTKRQEKQEPHWDRDASDRQWQEAVINAAIDKEKAERNYVEPGHRAGVGSRKEERAEEWGRKKEARQQAVNEKHWPINPPRHSGWPSFNEAAERTTNDTRRGAPSRLWAAWLQSDNAKAFEAALDEKGLMFARVTKDEAERSHREAEFAKAIGRRGQRFREGEIIVVTEPGLEVHRNGEYVSRSRFQKVDPVLARKFLKRLEGRVSIRGVDATLALSNQRAEQRAADREADRMDRATDIRDYSRRGRHKEIKGKVELTKSAGRTLGKAFDIVSDALDSLIAPKLTPEQIYEGEKAKSRRDDDAENSIDFSRHTADKAQRQRQWEDEQEEARRRERERGDRDR